MSDKQNINLDDETLLELSDEELLNMAEPSITQKVEEEQSEEESEDNYSDTKSDEEDYEELGEEDDESSDNSIDSPYESGFDNEEEYTDNDDYPETDDDDINEKPSKDNEKEESSESEKIDYKSVYEQIFAPFKANGKEIQVKSPDEVIQLMQMGANYNKKMAGIKQQLPILKMLERNNLLDQDRLSYAIDLLNGDQAAIAKLVKDSEIDLYDIDEESAENYVPVSKGVSEQEIALAEVIEDIKHSANYEQTIQVATELWDRASQEFIVNNPEVLRVIEQHISSGIFDTVWQEVERQQMLGKLEQLNSLEAYKVVGDHLNEKGVLGGSNPKEKRQATKQQQQENTRRKKQATQKPKGVSRRKSNKDVINPLELSDEEFEKLGVEHLM